ncbi:hypothetical protein AMECASPLE_023675 [Ameca splendens]|uniref:Uncharacterized protein n=1 Tax=Ameca splendens TaxID=208324 RepID=A0ABV1ACM2_9TELE
MFDGVGPVLALPPRCHFGVHVLLRGHNSLPHRYLRSTALLMYFHLSADQKKKEKKRKTEAVSYLNQSDSVWTEARKYHETLRGKEHVLAASCCLLLLLLPLLRTI